MVGVQLAGNNMLPPTLALIGVIWLQVGAVLLCEPVARRVLAGRAPARVIAVLGALGDLAVHGREDLLGPGHERAGLGVDERELPLDTQGRPCRPGEINPAAKTR